MFSENERAISPELRRTFFAAWSEVVSGREPDGEPPVSNKELHKKLIELIDRELEGHLALLAKQQNKELPPLIELRAEATPAEQLSYVQQVTARVHAVQNGNNACITPRLSRELNGMDCSMSTWAMRHELTQPSAQRAGITFAWGAPTGHSVGIVTLSDGETFYADGQGGFVEKIDVGVRQISDESKVFDIQNWEEIQSRHSAFFPRYVFSGQTIGVAATIGNVDSMLYKQYLGPITDDVRKKYGEDALIVEQLQPYARATQEKLRAVASHKNDADGNEISPLNEVLDMIRPENERMHASEEYRVDTERLRRMADA